MIPDELSAEERQRLEKWGEQHGFSRAQCRYAEEYALDYCRSHEKPYRDYVAFLRNSLRDRWSLRGYTADYEAKFNAREAVLQEAAQIKHALIQRGIGWSRVHARFMPVADFEPGEGRGPTMAEVRAAYREHCGGGPRLEVVG